MQTKKGEKMQLIHQKKKKEGNKLNLGCGDPFIGFCPYFLQDQKSEGGPSFFCFPTFASILTVTTVFWTTFL